MEDTYVLYRMYGRGGQLLYVGLTKDPPARFNDHASTKAWWNAVKRIDMEHFASEAELRQAETNAILTEQPAFNIVHNGFTGTRYERRQSTPPPTVEVEAPRTVIEDDVAGELVWKWFHERVAAIDAPAEPLGQGFLF